MPEVTKAQIDEARIWIRDCSWLDEAADLEDLTDEEVRRGIDSPRERQRGTISRGWVDSISSQLSI
jgi:hypothetical protein